MTLLLARAALIARAPARRLGRLAARLLAFGFKVGARAHLFEDTRVIHALLETAQHLLEALRPPLLARAPIGAFRFGADLWLRLRVGHAGLLLLHSTPFPRPAPGRHHSVCRAQRAVPRTIVHCLLPTAC